MNPFFLQKRARPAKYITGSLGTAFLFSGASMTSFAGRWFSTFGPMTLEQKQNRVAGTYQIDSGECTIHGEVRNGRLTFRYQEPNDQGEGWFEMERPGK